MVHDSGKANPIWQIAATGKMNVPALAKSGGTFKSPAGLNGLRHEFESLLAMQGTAELIMHGVATHHAGGRPCWTGTKGLSPVNRDEDTVLEQVNRFAELQQELGWWGLAYIEAILRCADAAVSEEGE
jgi:CRISPR-associated endonuclease/helicase Cas3